MNPKKVNWLFLSTLCFEAIVTIVLIFCAGKISINVVESLIVSQLILFVPAVLFLMGTRTNPVTFIRFRRLKVSTLVMVAVFTFLCMPLILLVNMISMMFVDNVVNDMMELIVTVPPALAIFLVGVLGPLNEEFVFRGVIYHGYQKSGRVIASIFMSALLFGLTHLNFNQMSYAFVVGIIGVLLVECTGSIISTMLFHMIINLCNIVPVFLAPDAFKDADKTLEMQLSQMHMTYKEYMSVEIAIYSVIALITTSLAICLLYAITQRENRTEYVRELFSKKEQDTKQSIISVPLVISIIICLAFMVLDVYLA